MMQLFPGVSQVFLAIVESPLAGYDVNLYPGPLGDTVHLSDILDGSVPGHTFLLASATLEHQVFSVTQKLHHEGTM